MITNYLSKNKTNKKFTNEPKKEKRKMKVKKNRKKSTNVFSVSGYQTFIDSCTYTLSTSCLTTSGDPIRMSV